MSGVIRPEAQTPEDAARTARIWQDHVTYWERRDWDGWRGYPTIRHLLKDAVALVTLLLGRR